jgi:arabinofuranan 3-O-arabinosyltransferase
MVGGVNGAAAFAVLPLGVLWLLTRTPGPRRRTLMLWWPVFTALGTLWWLVPLFLMGAYSPPFLEYIESAVNTTFPTTLFDALRGTSNWVPYVDTSSRAGNDLIRQFYLPINSGVVLFLGVAGVLLRRNPHRLFLALGMVLGLATVTMGHLGSVQGWAAADLNDLLDGVLAPLRNVHKFDPVVRLPIVLGLAWAVQGMRDELAQRREQSVPRPDRGAALVRRGNLHVVTATAMLAVLGAALPAVEGRITPAGGFVEVPGYWTEAASWLADAPGTTLLVPGSSFGDYVWGSPRDEPMQSLAAGRWAVRNAVPLAPPGNIRMLDAIEERLAQGAGSTGLAGYLRRAGISHLLVRNDLARSPDVPDPVLVHQAIAHSPGLLRVASFGPDVGGEASLEGDDGIRVLVNGGWQNQYPAIEVFEVVGSSGLALGSETQPIVVGGPEDLLDLADLGVLAAQPTALAADAPSVIDPASPLVLTDGLRAVERNFGRVHDGSSATLVPGEARRLGNPTRDYLADDADRWSTFARLTGAVAVSSSSSMSDANAFGTVVPGHLPYAAIDGDPETAWVANYQASTPPWWQVDFAVSRRVETVTVTAGPDKSEVVTVRTAAYTSEPITVNAGASRVVVVDDPSTTWLRIEDASGRLGNRLSIAEVTVPSLEVRRSLVLPTLPDGWGNPDAIVLRTVSDARTGCVEVDNAVRCVIGRGVADEEPSGFRRTVTLPASGAYVGRLVVRARPGLALDELLLRKQPIGVSASSQGNPDTRASVLAAFDGNPGTTWTAGFSDLRPVLSMNWLGKREVTGLDLSVAVDTAARLPQQLTLIWPRGRLQASVDADGRVRFPAIRTDQLTLRVEEAEAATSLDFDSVASDVPIGISELRLLGVPFLPIALPDQPHLYPCGSGPAVEVNGYPIETSVVASPAQLFAGEAVAAELCDAGGVELRAGGNQIDVIGSDSFAAASLVLTSGLPLQLATQEVHVAATGPVDQTLTPEDPSTLVTLRENSNPGWSGSQLTSDLDPLVIDGWQQAWRLRSSTEPLAATFRPDRVYRLGLLGGLLTLMALVVVSCFPSRRWPGAEATALETRGVSGAALGGFVVITGGVLAGTPGALVAAGGYLVAAGAARRSPEHGPWLLAALVLPAAAAYALRPWGNSSGWAGSWAWPHYLVVLVLGAVFGWLAEDGPRPPRFFNRIPGISTKR